MSVWAVRGLLVAAVGYAWVRAHVRPDAGDDGGIALVDVTHAAGIGFAHRRPSLHPSLRHIAPQLPATGAGVSVVDVDGDGWMDLFAVTSEETAAHALYRNRGDGTFEDWTGRWGAHGVNRAGHHAAMGSIWADIDGDGDVDGLIYGFGRQQVLRQEAGRLVDGTADAGLVDLWMNAACATWIDHDRDGDLDLFLGGYFPETLDLWDPGTTRVMHEDGEDARNGGRDLLLRNDGGRFTDVSEAAGLRGTRWTYACSVADLDADGWPDLYLANDWSGEALWRNREGVFEEVADAGLGRRAKAGMNVAFGDVHNRGEHAVYVTNIVAPGWVVQGNNLRVSRLASGGGLPDIARPPVDGCGYAWGAAFGDLDRDGWQDLVVTNGHTTAGAGDYWYDFARVHAGNAGIMQDVANWAPWGDRSMSGGEPSCLFRNLGGEGFVDVAVATGLDDLDDGRSVVLTDLRNVGALDVVIANQHGPLRVYRNDTPAQGHHWIGLALRGEAGNPTGVGATVRVRWAGQEQVHAVTAGGGMSAQADPRVFIGLGRVNRVDHIEVRWPDGVLQAVGGLAVDRYHTIVKP